MGHKGSWRVLKVPNDYIDKLREELKPFRGKGRTKLSTDRFLLIFCIFQRFKQHNLWALEGDGKLK